MEGIYAPINYPLMSLNSQVLSHTCVVKGRQEAEVVGFRRLWVRFASEVQHIFFKLNIQFYTSSPDYFPSHHIFITILIHQRIISLSVKHVDGYDH